MIHTKLCDLLNIEYPILQPGMGSFTSADLVAAVSNAGALGVLGASGRTAESLKAELEKLGQLTARAWVLKSTPQ